MAIHGKHVLVTGAGGFIGSHLVECLVRRGCRVRALLHYASRPDRGNLEFLDSELLRQVEVVRGDVCDPHHILEAVRGCEAVFHLAALVAIPHSYAAPGSYVRTNVTGTLNVLEACRIHGVARLVHTSTSECYGTARRIPIDEDHPLQAQSPYSATKIAADKLAESYHASFGLPVTTLRPFNTYGPRQTARAVLPTILVQLLSGQPELRLGDPGPVRDLLFVSDTVAAFVRAWECAGAVGQVMHVGTGQGVSVGELARQAMQVVGRTVPVTFDAERARPAASEVRRLVCAAHKARALLGWEPTVALAAGLEHTASFISRHLQLYRPEEYAR